MDRHNLFYSNITLSKQRSAELHDAGGYTRSIHQPCIGIPGIESEWEVGSTQKPRIDSASVHTVPCAAAAIVLINSPCGSQLPKPVVAAGSLPNLEFNQITPELQKETVSMGWSVFLLGCILAQINVLKIRHPVFPSSYLHSNIKRVLI
jgi:hypothetical protein